MPDQTPADPVEAARLQLRGAKGELANAKLELTNPAGVDPKAAAEYVADATSSVDRALEALERASAVCAAPAAGA